MSKICCNDCDKYIPIYDTTNNFCLECFNSRIPSKIRIMKWFNNEKMYEPLKYDNESFYLKYNLGLFSDTDSDSDSDEEEEQEPKDYKFRPQTRIGECKGCKMLCEECENLLI